METIFYILTRVLMVIGVIGVIYAIVYPEDELTEFENEVKKIKSKEPPNVKSYLE